VRRFAVIGLGRFGTMLAKALAEAGQEVIAIDSGREAVENIRDQVSLAVRLDATDDKALLAQEVDKVDVAIVAIGERFEAASLTTAHLKGMGVHYVAVRAATPIQAKILSLIGADEVINPEEDSALRLAYRLVSPNIVDSLQIAEGFRMQQIRAPKAFHGKRVVDIKLRQQYSVNLVAIKKRYRRKTADGVEEYEDRIKDIPKPSDVVEPDDILVLIGRSDALERLPD
jgi:trk system potassium uptake protein TrkA